MFMNHCTSRRAYIYIYIYIYIQQSSVTTSQANTTSISRWQELSNALLEKGDDISWTDYIEEKKNALSGDPTVAIDLAFATSLVGDLAESERLLKEYCPTIQSPTCTKVWFSFDIDTPLDANGNTISGTQFEILWKPETKTQKTPFTVDLHKNITFRTKVSKKWYTDFFSTEWFFPWENQYTSLQSRSIKPILIPAQKSISIHSDDKFSTTTDSYVFTGSAENFEHPDRSPIDWPIDIYFFDLNSETPDFIASDILSLNIFTTDRRFLWSGMVTFGMPLVKAYAWDTELKIRPDAQIKWTGNIRDFRQLLIEYGLTQEDMEKIAQIPPWTIITLEKAIELKLPPYWRIDADKGFWEESSYTILDQDGNFEFFIY
jgi:DNA-binding XRE family transcriptional regulator